MTLLFHIDRLGARREWVPSISIQSDLSLEQPISNSNEGKLLDLISAELDKYGEDGDEVALSNGHDPRNPSFENSADSRTNNAPEEALLTEEEDVELTEVLRQFL